MSAEAVAEGEERNTDVEVKQSLCSAVGENGHKHHESVFIKVNMTKIMVANQNCGKSDFSHADFRENGFMVKQFFVVIVSLIRMKEK